MTSPSQSGSLCADFRKALADLPPPPKFDRVVVHDDRSLHWIERQEQPPVSLVGLVPSLLGIPVIKDSTVEVGVIEFRLGDKLFRRFHLPELRA